MTIDQYHIDAVKLGKRIHKARHACGMKQQDVCDRIECSTTHLSHIENGKALPTLKMLFWFCMEYHQTMDYFLMDSYDSNPAPKIELEIGPKLQQLEPEGLSVVSDLTDRLLEYQKQYKKSNE